MGPTNPPPFPQPYGTNYAPPPGAMPAFAGEAVMRRKGGTAVKVWGILLLIAALFALMNLGGSLAMAFGGGMDVSALMIGLEDEDKADIRKMMTELTSLMTQDPMFWVSIAGQSIMTILAFISAVQLLRSRPSGRVAAIALSILVLLVLPVGAHAQLKMGEAVAPKQEQLMRNMIQRQMDKQASRTPPAKEGEVPVEPDSKARAQAEAAAKARSESRQRQIDELMAQMNSMTKVINVVSVVLVTLFTLVMDGLLLFFMTRPSIREYLENAVKYKDSLPPGFHPALGLPLYAPPPGAAAASPDLPNTGGPPQVQ